MEERANRRLEARLDRQQSDDPSSDDPSLVTIKVPLTHLAYYNSSSAFERANGEIEVNGVPYRYVKRRICNDTLEMQCIPNQTELKWRKSGSTYFQLVNDIDQRQGSTDRPGVVKAFTPDPYICIQPVRLDAPIAAALLRGDNFLVTLAAGFPSAGERPPGGTVA